jgi:hypothetical protein
LPNKQAYTVRYEAVNAMLLNEFLKEHRKVENGKLHRGPQSTGSTNPEGERPASGEQSRTASAR